MTTDEHPIIETPIEVTGDIATNTLALIERVALDPAADVDKLERMFALQERLLAREAEAQWNAAMNAAQAEIAPVARTAENKQTGSWWAKLEEVDKAIRPIYLRHGFSLSYNTVKPLIEGNIRVEIRCAHGAHVERFYREAGPDVLGPKGSAVKTTLHGIGSTETYLKRYGVCGIFNVVFRDQDDDGVGANFVTEEQAKEILEKIRLAKLGPKFLVYVKAQPVSETGSLAASVATIPGSNYKKAVSTLDEHIAKLAAKEKIG